MIIEGVKYKNHLFINQFKRQEFKNMKKILSLLAVTIMMACIMTGCSQADRVEYNLTKQADSFNIVRQLTVINCITGDTLFQMSGKMSITADTADKQLEVLVEDNGTYVKHIVGLSKNVSYIIEDLNLGDNAVSKYRYTLNFNPKMWFPNNVETID